jgi:RimJ/RimL family protein N-acetyltransferase
MPTFDLQPILENENYILQPLEWSDFNTLYGVASDPDIWEQHPNKDRWKNEVFQVFFEGAIQSRGAFKIIDKTSSLVIGSTRIYDFNDLDNSIHMGYTFYAKRYWGTGVNHKVKTLLLDYLFQYVDLVIFHIGAHNIRSQISITRLGAIKTGEIEVAYHGEAVKNNFIYQIQKASWKK